MTRMDKKTLAAMIIAILFAIIDVGFGIAFSTHFTEVWKVIGAEGGGGAFIALLFVFGQAAIIWGALNVD